MAKENLSPNVQSFEKVESSVPITNASGMLVALPVICDRGPLEPTIVDNAQFVKIFMDDSIKRSTNISQVVAYELSKFTNILVCRACDSKEVAVMGSNKSKDGLTAEIDNGSVTVNFSGSAASLPFAIIARYPSSTNIARISWTKHTVSGDSGVMTIENLTDPNDTVVFEFSMDMDAVDGYGRSKFITEVNRLQNLVTVVVNQSLPPAEINQDIPKADSFQFGKVASYTTPNIPSSGADTGGASVTAALNKLTTVDTSRVVFITDAGLANPTIAGMIGNLADKLKALGVITHPPTITNYTGFKAYLGNLTNSSLKTSHNYGCTPWYTDYSIADFPIKMPETVSYIKRVIANKKSNLEFAPVFGTKYGIADGDKDSLSIKFMYNPNENPPTEANTANEVQVLGWNPVVYRESKGFAFFVNNWTLQGKKDPMSEENNRRLWNQVQYDLNSTMEDFLAEPNNEVTRENIGNAIDTYFKTVVLNWGYTVANYKFRTEPYNPAKPNTIDVYVDIQFTGSTKWIRVFYKSVPVIQS